MRNIYFSIFAYILVFQNAHWRYNLAPMILKYLFPNENFLKFNVFEGESGKGSQIDASSHFSSTFVIFAVPELSTLGKTASKPQNSRG